MTSTTRAPASATMTAWQLDRLGGTLALRHDLAIPEPRAGSVLVRVEASILMSYLKPYVAGELPIYHAPARPFTPGGNAAGTIVAVGRDVWHVKPGQRVVTSSHIVANERVVEPGQSLLGVTALGPTAETMQADWPDGTLAEYALVPASTVTPADGLDQLSAPQLAATVRFLVPYGGLLRGRLAPSETLIVVGASGAYGSAGVLLGLALGAARVIAAGRDTAALAAVARIGGPRVVPVALRGDVAADAAALREAAGGGAHVSLDLVGGAGDPNATLSGLRALHRGGRCVLMGSMRVPLPIDYLAMMANQWELLGTFMYPADAYVRLLALVRAGLLDPNALRVHAFPFAELPAAMERANEVPGLECVALSAPGADGQR